jgi:hypothetical protein
MDFQFLYQAAKERIEQWNENYGKGITDTKPNFTPAKFAVCIQEVLDHEVNQHLEQLVRGEPVLLNGEAIMQRAILQCMVESTVLQQEA